MTITIQFQYSFFKDEFQRYEVIIINKLQSMRKDNRTPFNCVFVTLNIFGFI